MSSPVFALALALSDELNVQLQSSIAGPVSVSVVHPGDTVPGYVQCGTGISTVRVAAVGPAQAARGGCGNIPAWAATFVLQVDRCYPVGENFVVLENAATLTEYAERNLSDMAAIHRTLCRVLDGEHTYTVGAWGPLGVHGLLLGGALTVTVTDLELPCC